MESSKYVLIGILTETTIVIASVTSEVTGGTVPLQRCQCGQQLCLLPLEHTQPLCRPDQCSTWYPGSGFQLESITDFILDQYLQQQTAFSNIKIFMSKGTVQKEEERNGLSVFQE